MITLPLVSSKNILIITPKGLYYSLLQVKRKEYLFETFRNYKSFTELFDHESISSDLMVVLNNNSSFEDEVEIEAYLSDETIIQDALESEINKKSTIKSNTIFHYLKIKSDHAKEKQRYKLFGFDGDAYSLLLKSIPNKSALSLITTAESLLFNFCQTFISKPYIGVYRFNHQDILIVSDTDHLLFSRSHFDEKSDFNSTIRSLEYVIQRFKEYKFEIYVGGGFTDEAFVSLIKERLETPVQMFEHTTYPIFLKGLKRLPKIYNFIPKNISIKRFVNKLRDSLVLMTFSIFVVSVITFFINYSHYQSSLIIYQNMEKEYKAELKSLALIGNESLKQLSKIKKLRSLENLKSFQQLLKYMKPFSKEMSLVSFDWKARKRGDFLDISMKKAFMTLSELDAFLLAIEENIKVFEEKVPRFFIEKEIDLKNFELKIRITAKNTHRNLSTYKKGTS